LPSPSYKSANNGKQKFVNLMPNFTEEKSFEIDQEIARSYLASKKANFVAN